MGPGGGGGGGGAGGLFSPCTLFPNGGWELVDGDGGVIAYASPSIQIYCVQKRRKMV